MSRPFSRLKSIESQREEQPSLHRWGHSRDRDGEKSSQSKFLGSWPTFLGNRINSIFSQQKTPVVFGFEPPIMSKPIDPSSYYIVKIEEQYNVQVMLRIRPKLHAILVTVKGVEWEIEQVKKATLLLMKYMCDNLAVSPSSI